MAAISAGGGVGREPTNGPGIAATSAGGGVGREPTNGPGIAAASAASGFGFPVGVGRLGVSGPGMAATTFAGGVGRLLTSGAGIAALARAADETKDTAAMSLNELRGRVRIVCSLRGGVDTSPKNNCRASVPQMGNGC
jgi:hypothetical protein